MWNYGEPKLTSEEFDSFTSFSPKRIAWFLSMVTILPDSEGGCWIWNGAHRAGGYGMARICGSSRAAHRVSWLIHKGPIPTGPDPHNKIFVCHNCPNGDTAGCVNPNHLWLGTASDNMIDRTMKGRDNPVMGDNHWQRRNPGTLAGSKNGMAKLTIENVIEIRKLLAAGELNYIEIAKIFSVDCTSIGLINKGKTWKGIGLIPTLADSQVSPPADQQSAPSS